MDGNIEELVQAFQAELQSMEAKMRRAERENSLLRKQVLKMQKERQKGVNNTENETDPGIVRNISSMTSYSDESKPTSGSTSSAQTRYRRGADLFATTTSADVRIRILESKLSREKARHGNRIRELEGAIERARVDSGNKISYSNDGTALKDSIHLDPKKGLQVAGNPSPGNKKSKVLEEYSSRASDSHPLFPNNANNNTTNAAASNTNTTTTTTTTNNNNNNNNRNRNRNMLQNEDNLVPPNCLSIPPSSVGQPNQCNHLGHGIGAQTPPSSQNNTFCSSPFQRGSSEEHMGSNLLHGADSHHFHSLSADLSLASRDFSKQTIPPSKFSSSCYGAPSEGNEAFTENDLHLAASPIKLGDYDSPFIARASSFTAMNSAKASNTEDLIRQTASRQELRRKRLQQLVLLRNAESPITDPASASCLTPGDNVASDVPPSGPLSINVPELKLTNSPLPQTNLSHSKDVPIATSSSANSDLHSKGSSVVHHTTGHTSHSVNTSNPPFNPNQIGTEVKEEVKNRAWYICKILSRTLLKAIPGDRVESENEGHIKREEFSLLATSKPSPAPENSHETFSSVRYDTSDFSDSFAFSDDEGPERSPKPRSPILSTVSAKDPLHSNAEDEITPSLFKNLNSEALQRAINDVYCFHFRCFKNEPFLTPGPLSKSYPLAPFEDENNNKDLLEAFSPAHMTAKSKEYEELVEEGASHFETKDGKSSHTSSFVPSSYRADEVRVLLHAPVLFSQIRSFLGVKANDFRAALECAPWRQSLSPGKSGTTLLYFGDYVMKSVKEREFEFLKTKFIGQYVAYVERNPHTLLPRFYSLITIKWLKLGTQRRFLLMQNVFTTRYYINRIYDVKGSSVGRTGLEGDLSNAPRTAFGALLLKDNDLPEQLIICGPFHRARILGQLRSDTIFLQGLSIVDYSCLIGVRSRIFSRREVVPTGNIAFERRASTNRLIRKDVLVTEDQEKRLAGARRGQEIGGSTSLTKQELPSGSSAQGNNTSLESENFIAGCEGGLISLPIYSTDDDTTAREDVYYIGIIDVLQTYTPAKQLEYFAKGFFSDRKKISVIPPKEYGERLYASLEHITV